ncbi:MAG: SusC/RagA family TonB-linked outer membrane protein, partial [Agriterribacter sp.]
ATQYPKQVDSWEYASLLNEAEPGSFTNEEIQKYKDGSDPDKYPNVNFVDAVLKKSAMQTGHNISLANSNAGTQYQLAFGYLYQNGIIAKNDYNRYNVRLSMINKIAKGLKLSTRLYGMHAIDNQPAPPATLDFNDMLTLIGQAVRYPAFYAGKLSNGDWGLGNSGQGTPLSMLNSESFYKGKSFQLLINERADWEIVKNLTVSVIGGFTYNTLASQRFLANQRMNNTITIGPGNLTQVNTSNYYKTLQQLIEYSKKIGAHEISLLAGHSFESFRFDTLNAYRGGFVTNQLTQLKAGDASSQTNTGEATENTLDSYFGRLRYSFQDKYLLEGVIRRDGSSRFPPQDKYATFPAVALGWRLSNERFIKDNFKWIDDLKLKASYGVLGNQNIGNNYPYQSLFVSGSNYPIGTGIASGVAVRDLVDSTIHWESTRTKDIGLDLTVLNKSLSIGVTYFDRYTYDILVAPISSVSNVLGYNVGYRNSGSLSNRGWEFTASYKNSVNAFNYYVSGNLTILKNKVLDLGVGNVNQPNGLVGNGSTLFIGYPMELYYGLVADGLFTDQNDIDSYAKQSASINPKTQPGDIRYKDISGPDGKPDGQVDLTYDRAALGSRIPKYTYGINLGGNYKGFDVSILLQGIAGVKGLLNNYAGFAFYVNGTIQRYQADGRWTKENPDRNATYPRLEVISNQGTANSRLSSFWLQNASYLRIKNIQLGYTVPAAVLKRAGIGGLRIYASAENFATFKKYPEGWDPEINSSGAYYPILANYTLGLNLNF